MSSFFLLAGCGGGNGGVASSVTNSQANQELSLLAGSIGGPGTLDGNNIAARFYFPNDIAIDVSGTLYVADSRNYTVRKITVDGVVSTLAGSPGVIGTADGRGSAAQFIGPSDVAVDSNGNVWIIDSGHIVDSAGNVLQRRVTVRRIQSNGTVTTVAGDSYSTLASSIIDGTGSSARFINPHGIVIDAADNIYVLDGGIRKMTPAGVVTTITQEISGSGLAIDQASNFYVIDNGIINKMSPTGSITTSPNRVPGGNSINVDPNGYLIATGEAAIFKIDQAGGVSAFAGSTTCCTRGSVDGIGTAAQFDSTFMRAVTDKAGNLFIADTFNNAIRKLTPQGVVTTVAGAALVRGGADGAGANAQFRRISGIAAVSGGDIFLTDSDNFTIRKVTSSGITSTFAGGYLQQGTADGIGAAARFFNPIGITSDTSNNLWVTDISSNPLDINFLHSVIRRVTLAGAVATVAGAPGADTNLANLGSADGTGDAATFRNPIGIAADPSGNKYIADSANHTIRKITPEGLVSTFAGNPGDAGSTDGIGGSARFQNPVGITTDSSGNVFVVDVESRQIAGNYFSPIIPAGIAKPVNTVIRKITPNGIVTTLAGAPGTAGSVDGIGSNARFNNAHGITADASGNLYVADTGNHTVRKITSTGSVTTIAGVANNAGIRLGSAPGYLSAPSGVAIIAPNILAISSDNSVLKLTLP